ncbi:MAG: HAMP domain-containing sensor histidine kinase [Saprospiraceae bacterium]|nr:HAMP domain-containing sensor histidine kinase [Saprospiraceae bacterium]
MKAEKLISGWKGTLILAGLVIVAVSTWYSTYLAKKLSEGERSKVDLYVRAQREMSASTDLDKDLTFETDVILSAGDIPVITTDLQDNITGSRAISDTSQANLTRELERIKKHGAEPIVNDSSEGPYKIWYQQSQLLTLLTYFPIFQLLLVGAFIVIGFVGLNSARRAEQNRVWVGMAKETAHQLGTPISAILAWIEHLKETAGDEHQEVVHELKRDVQRLEKVAERFSKIGSAPILEPINIYDELERSRDYMSRRAPRKIRFDFPDPAAPPLTVHINAHLFNWVIENLLRNALDAMDDEGVISAEVSDEDDYICIDITDSGKGIPPSKLKKVFEPGFTTKQRGWGLGLSLAKRIIENYHSGKIFVKKSRIDEGTTFTIKLPKRVR